jgi:hypothetical protein
MPVLAGQPLQIEIEKPLVGVADGIDRIFPEAGTSQVSR